MSIVKVIAQVTASMAVLRLIQILWSIEMELEYIKNRL
jgi:hypothetical protein